MKLFRQEPLKGYVWFQEGPGLRQWQWTDSGMKVINVSNIIGDGTVDLANTGRYIALTEFESKYKHFAVEPNDILVASSGNTYGKVGRISENQLPVMMNTSVIRFQSKFPDQLDSDYLYVYLRSPHFAHQLAQFVTGGAQPNFGPSHLNLMQILLPELKVQQTIGTVIKRYDSLIENNRRRINLLEEAATLIYREWFVHLRFPGHEQARIVDGVPEGWERVTIGEFAPFQYGRALKEVNRVPGEIPVVGSSGIVGYHHKHLVRGPGIVIGRKGTVGAVHWLATDFFPIDTTYYVEPDRVSNFLFWALRHVNFVNTDVAVPGLNRNAAHSRSILIPTTPVFDRFENITQKLSRHAHLLAIQKNKLTQARDLLLPRLMSGEVEL